MESGLTQYMLLLPLSAQYLGLSSAILAMALNKLAVWRLVLLNDEARVLF